MAKKTTNYEAIKNMSKPEMAAMLYIMQKPILEALRATDEEKQKIKENITAFLNAEVGANEAGRSEEKS